MPDTSEDESSGSSDELTLDAKSTLESRHQLKTRLKYERFYHEFQEYLLTTKKKQPTDVTLTNYFAQIKDKYASLHY